MPVCGFNSLPNGEYLNLFIVASLPNKYYSGKTSFQIKSSSLLAFPDNKANTSAV